MINYTTAEHNDGKFYVLNGDTGATVGGPYKNDESAKRRIRDLKRKEAIATQPLAVPPTTINDDFPISPVNPIISNEPVLYVDNHATIDRLSVAVLPVVVTDEMRKPSPPVAKLAMSSAYGKINRPVGVYPAVSKRTYRHRNSFL